MRIAFLSNANSVHLKEWAEYFAHRLGHDVSVLSLQRPALAYEGVRVLHVGSPLTSTKAGWCTAIPRIRAALREGGAELLVAYRIVSYGFLATFTGFRPLAMAGQRESLMEENTVLSRFCVRHAVRRADLINAWAPNMRDSALRFGAPPERVLTCSRGIDLSLYTAIPEKRPTPLRVVMTRALKPTYNVGQLLEAMPRVLQSEPGAICEIAGNGPERPRLERMTDALRLRGSVRFSGLLDRGGVIGLLQPAHVYVSTTRTDGLPLSHFEAMAAGLFPVVSDIPANRTWIRDGENGFLVPLDAPEVLADRILAAYRDPDLRSRVIRRNRELVEREFDRDRNLRRIAAAYEELVARRRDSGR